MEQGHSEGIIDLSLFFSNFKDLPLDLILEETNLLHLVIFRFNEITLIPENQKIICSTLYILIRLTENKLNEMNEHLNQNFILKLFSLFENEEALILSLNLISQLIGISQYSFSLFHQNGLFEKLHQLLTIQNEIVSTFCALICQNSISFLNSKKEEILLHQTNFLNQPADISNLPIETPPNDEKSETIQTVDSMVTQNSPIIHDQKPLINNELTIENNLQAIKPSWEINSPKDVLYNILRELITQCPFPHASFIARAAIPLVIQLESISPSDKLISECFQFAIQLSTSDSIEDLQISISIISELINTENPHVYQNLLSNLEIFGILNIGLTCDNHYVQIDTIDDISQLIINVPESHQIMIDSRLIFSLIQVSIEGNYYTKPKIVEAICRIFFNQESPLHEVLLQSPETIELLILALDNHGIDTQAEIIDCFYRLLSLNESTHGQSIKVLLDAGLIEALESLMEETESSIDEEENIKTQKLISKAECLKNELLEIVAG